MNTYIFLYPETSFFEVNLVAYFMKTVGNVFIVTERGHEAVCTNEGVRILSDIFLDEVQISDVDAFIICGGEIANIKEEALLHQTIKRCRENNKIVGGICAGREIVADAVGLTYDASTTCVMDKIVLSPGNEYVDFALEIGKAGNIFKDKADYDETVNYFKLFKEAEEV